MILLDTIGELSACWGLADIAFVGGSFGHRGGQNMLEPAAFGAAVMFGPNTWNFRDIVSLLLSAKAAVQLQTGDDLATELSSLLQNRERRIQLGTAARQLLRQQQGALQATTSLLVAASALPRMDIGSDRCVRRRPAELSGHWRVVDGGEAQVSQLSQLMFRVSVQEQTPAYWSLKVVSFKRVVFLFKAAAPVVPLRFLPPRKFVVFDRLKESCFFRLRHFSYRLAVFKEHCFVPAIIGFKGRCDAPNGHGRRRHRIQLADRLVKLFCADTKNLQRDVHLL